MRHGVEQLGSVSLTAVHAFTPVLDEVPGANHIAEQGAVALARLVVEVRVPVTVAAGNLGPVLGI